MYGVGSGESLKSRGEGEVLGGDVVLFQLPYDGVLRVDLDDAVVVAAREKRVAVGKAYTDEAAARERAKQLALGIELHRFAAALLLARDVRPLRRLSHFSELIVDAAADARDRDRARHLLRTGHFVND